MPVVRTATTKRPSHAGSESLKARSWSVIMRVERGCASGREVGRSGVARLLAQDEVDHERGASEEPVAGPDLDPVTPDFTDPQALQVGDDVGRGRRLRNLDPEARSLLERRLAGGTRDLDRQIVRAGVGLEHGDDEAATVRGRQARDVDLAEDADRADLPVLRRERVVA